MHCALLKLCRVAAASILLALLAVPAGAQLRVPEFLVMSDGSITPMDDLEEKQTLPAGEPDSVVQQGGMRFNIFYQDSPGAGFRDNQLGELRQTRFEEAVSYIAQVLNATGTLDVLVQPSTAVNNGTLASAGTLFRDIDGYQNGNAFLRISSGAKPSATRPEVVVRTNFAPGQPYHLGAGIPPNNQFDLQSVLLHEMTHAMGFLSLADDDGTPPAGFTKSAYTVFESFLVRRTGVIPLFPFDGLKPIFAGLLADLIGSNVGFNGPLSKGQFGSVPPIFSPNPYQDGSSMSHWETGNIPGGAVMEHAFSPGEIIRGYPAFEALALRDLGWLGVNTNNLTRGPTAGFTVNDPTVNTGQQIQFSDDSLSGSRPITAWAWNFGDGTTSNQQNPTKTYASAGDFNVTLTVTTAVGSDVETRNSFIHIGEGPKADFTANPVNGTAPLQVQFTDNSNGNGNPITSHLWTFGDGGTSTQSDPVHTYAVAGTFTVTLTVGGINGTDTRAKPTLVKVNAPPGTGGDEGEEEGDDNPGGNPGGGDTGGGGCGGKKSLDGKGIDGDPLVSSAMAASLLLFGLRRRK